MNFRLALVLALVAAVASHLPTPEEEMNMMRLLCARGTDEMFNGIDACYQQHATQRNREIAAVCKERLFGHSDREPSFYAREICQNLSRLGELETCFNENNQNRKEMVNEEEAGKCVAELFQRFPINPNPAAESADE